MYRPARGGRSCERFGGYKTINRIPLPLPFSNIFLAISLLAEVCSKLLDYAGIPDFKGLSHCHTAYSDKCEHMLIKKQNYDRNC